ncbi:MAG: Beta-lactamase class C-like and penicillin binding proteins (PBPs) superfamily [uncultured Truepera sp.]|uniref:Beta-lactamase class C-like and penicillin binding proteins (PBPs) superfamily n=1 Tax=uncultured Truepera sp. TaxID=543023 RepID=A0A6J4VGI2_9DEIN|nr:MAG: Beta-lactamase class C-like and penicillin binding proteins (PBPs) superfamily [uncultured Truepera sp.]
MFTKRVLGSVTAAVCLVGSGTFAQPSFDTAQLDVFVEEMMDAYDVPGVGLAVVEDGEVGYVRGYGVRDVTTGAPVTPNTQFAIGSTTKSFTALGMMLLVEEGRVDLDAPVTTYLPEFRLSDPESTRTATVRHLLSHTTGLVRTDASTFDTSVTSADIIEAAATTPLVGKPGETFVYSNVNTIIAGEIIERITGESWEDFTRERVLDPLGMTTATLSIDELKQQRDVALPHVLDVLNGLQTANFLSLGADAPAGAVNASAAEMARYVRFQVGDGAPLVSQASLGEMHKGQIAAPDFNLPGMIAAQARAVAERPEDVPDALVTDQKYGLYWGVERFLGEKLVQHGGNVTGLTANATLLPESRSGVVVLANAEGANAFMEVVRLHVAKLLLGRPDPDVNATLQAQLEVLGQDNASRKADLEAARSYQPKRAELAPLAGTYRSLADPKPTEVRVVGGRTLRLESGFQSVRFSVELLPLGEDRFIANNEPLIGTVVRFVGGEGGRTIEMESLLGALPLAEQAGRAD